MPHPSILVADDEPDVQMLLRLFFERQGHQVFSARDGQEAVDVARRHTPDIMVMDIQMPRMTGIEAVRVLRADPIFANTPIIALTAHVRSYVPAEVMHVGFDTVLAKPFDFGQVYAVISALLQRVK
jgi:two-component system alkaline phosphatase synthesis response regulator PhoP